MPVVVVPLDGSQHALVALPVAREFCRLLGAALNVVHVGQRRLPARATLHEIGLTPEDLTGVVWDVVASTPAEGILSVAGERGCTQIVLCTRTGLTEAAGGMGPVAEAVVAGAHCPVVLVPAARGIRPWVLQRILLPHDGTPTSAMALRPAVELADASGAALHVLHVGVPHAKPPEEAGTLTMPQYVDQPQYEWANWAQEFLQRLGCDCRFPVQERLHLHVARGKPEEEIPRFADAHASDLIVLAWRGHLEQARAEILKAVVERAPCPVYVVRVA